MSAPETDPFYDALRNRLHDYEEPLPAGGWAGIAPQLTPAPPPPRPTGWWQRAPKRRLAALILLLILPTVTLLWWRDRTVQVAGRRHSAAPVATAPEQLATSPTRTPTAPLATPSRKQPAAPAPAPVASSSETAPLAATAPRRLTHHAPDRAHVRPNVTARAGSAATITAGRDSATPTATKPVRALALTTKRRRTARTWARPDAPVAFGAARAASRPATAARPTTTDAVLARPTATAGAVARSAAAPGGLPTAPGTTSVLPDAPAKPAVGNPAEPASPPTTAAVVPGLLSAPEAARPATPASAPVATTVPEPQSPVTTAAVKPANTPDVTSKTSALGAGAEPIAVSADTPSLAAAVPTAPADATLADANLANADLAWLTGLTPTLLLAGTPALPAPLPAPAGPRDSLRLRPARLGLGLLLGAATARRGAGSVPARLRTLEDPDYGASAEVAARYFLTSSLALRTGLGYAEQRQQLALTIEKHQSYWASAVQVIVRNSASGPDTLRVLGYTLRDTLLSRQSRRYQLTQRYLTLPLLAEWRPRIPFRWQPVLSLGATTSWLLSGSYLSTTNGCNCEQQTQRRGGAGPFAPVSTALSVGLGLDYALSPRATLLLRPTAQYWLTPTARGGAARPLSAGLQLGLLFDSHRP